MPKSYKFHKKKKLMKYEVKNINFSLKKNIILIKIKKNFV